METGISPSQSKEISFGTLQGRLSQWADSEFGGFKTMYREMKFAYNAAKKQQSLGSRLYRAGGRTDIFSNEVQPLLDRLKNSLGEAITDIELVKE